MAHTRGKVFLFGTFRVHTPQDVPLEGASPRVQSLCAYLALHQAEPMDRRRLAFLLWPQAPESAARRNLRQYLHRLRHFLQPLDPAGELIVVESMTITFDPQRLLWVDARDFLTHLRRAEESDGPARLTALRAAVDLYRGDLVQNLYDDWCNAEQERFRQMYEYALHTLVATCESQKRLDEAVHWAERALQVNPLQENLYRTLMRLYTLMGERERALETYTRCRRVLREALDTEPMPETEHLYQEILAAAPSPPVVTSPAEPPAALAPSPAPAPTARPPDRPLLAVAPPLLGREDDLRWLDGILRARAPAGALILVDGEVGIGKTRLFDEWISRLPPDYLVLTAEAGEFEHVIPYHPLKAAIREHAEHIFEDDIPYRDRWAPALTYLLPTLLGRLSNGNFVPGSPHIDTWVILEGLEWFLRGLSERRPTLLWIDEAHWADHPTWQAIAYLAQRLTPNVPLFLALTCRNEDITEPNRQIWRRLQRASFTHHRTLARLGRKQTYELIRHILGPNVNPRLMERLYTVTEGIPFFVVETARALAHVPERRLLVQTGGTDAFSLPERVRQVVESRLDLLSEQERSLLQVAAVVGRTFTVDLLRRVADVEETTLLAALDRWLRRGLVRETPSGYTFSHGLVHRVVYNELTLARRRWLHRRVATLLQQEADISAATVARHFAESDRPTEAVPFFMQAAEDALRIRSYNEARACALEVLRLWRQKPGLAREDDPARVDVNLQLAQAYSLSNLSEDALTLLEETRRLAEQLGDPRRMGRVLIRLAQVFWQRGGPQAARDHARAALRWAQTAEDRETQAAALRMLGRANIVLSAFDDAIMALRHHLNALPADDPRQAVVWSYLAVAWARVGHWEQAFDAAHRAIHLAESRHSPSHVAMAYMHLGFIQAERHRWAAAVETTRHSLELTEGIGFTPVYFMARSVHAYALGHVGPLEPAERGLQEIITLAEQERYRVLVHLVPYFLASLYLHHRRFEEALRYARTAAQLAETAGDRWTLAVALRLEGDAMSALPHPDWPAVEERLVRSVTILRQVRGRPELARSYLSLRRLYDRAARMAWAVDCHFRALTIFEELGMVEELRAAQGQAGLKGKPTEGAISAPLTGPAWLRTEESA